MSFLKIRTWGPQDLLQHLDLLGWELRKLAWGEEERASQETSMTSMGVQWTPWMTSPATGEGWQYVSRAVAPSEIISFSCTFPFLSPRKWGQGGLEWDTNERGSVSALTKHKTAHSVSDLYGNTEDSLYVLLDFLGEGMAAAQKQQASLWPGLC